ncbi:hypothetical protein [Ewingella americana]
MKDLEQFTIDKIKSLTMGIDQSAFLAIRDDLIREKAIAEIALKAMQAKPVGAMCEDGTQVVFFSKTKPEVKDMAWWVAFWPIDIYTTPQPAHTEQVIQDGWKLVPIEPTEDMIVNGFESEPDKTFSDDDDWEAYDAMSGCEQAAHRAKLCWAAMLASSPKPE